MCQVSTYAISITLVGSLLVGDLDSPKTHTKGEDIIELMVRENLALRAGRSNRGDSHHVKGVCYECERVDGISCSVISRVAELCRTRDSYQR